MYSFVITKIAKFDLETNSKQKITVYLSGSPESHCGEEFSRYMKDKNITDIFCFCEPTYNIQIFKQHNINYHNIKFPDGSPPTTDTLKTFNILFNKILIIMGKINFISFYFFIINFYNEKRNFN